MEYLYIVLAILIATLIIVLITMKMKKSKTSNVIDENFIEDIILKLGLKENIKNVNIDNSRLKIDVIDIKKVNLEELHKMSSKGVFVTNKSIKLLFEYDSEKIKQYIDKQIK